MATFPDHVIGLAGAILRGERAEEVMHDALLEIGLPFTAHHFIDDKDHSIGSNCTIALTIYSKNLQLIEHVKQGNVYKELREFLKR